MAKVLQPGSYQVSKLYPTLKTKIQPIQIAITIGQIVQSTNIGHNPKHTHLLKQKKVIAE